MKFLILACTASLITASLTDCLALIPETDGSTVMPESPGFSVASLGVNFVFTYKPASVFQASTTKGVAAAVVCAKQNNVIVSPKSGI
jgi:hypothetical protein